MFPFSLLRLVRAKPTRIRITSVPHGDAPLWVREKWVGVELETVLGPSSRNVTATSIFAHPSFFASVWRRLSGQSFEVNGYPVPVMAAVEALQKSSPEAATWWRQNTPQLLSPTRLFVFDAKTCEVIAPRV